MYFCSAFVKIWFCKILYLHQQCNKQTAAIIKSCLLNTNVLTSVMSKTVIKRHFTIKDDVKCEIFKMSTTDLPTCITQYVCLLSCNIRCVLWRKTTGIQCADVLINTLLTWYSVLSYCLYRMIKKSAHLMITIQNVTSNFKVSPASLQTFINKSNCVLEERVRYSTVQIPNVFCDGHLQIIDCVEIVLTHIFVL
jgi:hypothetical protein